MKPPNMPANVADAITVVSITNITIVPEIRGQNVVHRDTGGVGGVAPASSAPRRGRRSGESRTSERGRRGLQRHREDGRDDVLDRNARQRVPEIGEPASDVPADQVRERGPADHDPDDDQDPTHRMPRHRRHRLCAARARRATHPGLALVVSGGTSNCPFRSPPASSYAASATAAHRSWATGTVVSASAALESAVQ